MQIESKNIIQVVASVVKSSAVDEHSEIGSPKEWTSLVHVEILMELEKVFSLKIPLRHLPRLVSIEKIVTYIRERNEPEL